jgi:hypothetical protein
LSDLTKSFELSNDVLFYDDDESNFNIQIIKISHDVIWHFFKLIYIDEYQTSRIIESTLSKFKSHSVKESETRNASFTNDRSRSDSFVSDFSVRTLITNDSIRAFSVNDSSVKASITNDSVRAFFVNDFSIRASITNDSVRAFCSQKTFLQKSSQISSHVDTTFRIMMSSSSLNEKNKYSDINNETDDEEDNSIIVFRKNDDRNKSRFLWTEALRKNKYKSTSTHENILRIVKFYFVTWLMSDHADKKFWIAWSEQRKMWLSDLIQQAWMNIALRMNRRKEVLNKDVTEQSRSKKTRKTNTFSIQTIFMSNVHSYMMRLMIDVQLSCNQCER